MAYWKKNNNDSVKVNGGVIYLPSNVMTESIGKKCSFGTFCEVGPSVIINDGTRIGAGAFIPDGISLGENVFIGPNVVFCNDKYPPSYGEHWMCTFVGDNVSIGANATILPGVTIGRGAKVGAGAVVTKSIPPGEIWASPAAKKLSNGGS